MKRWQNVLAQILLSSTQVLNVAAEDGLIQNKDTKESIALGIGIAQLTISLFAHRYNEDGTPQTVGYKKPGEVLKLD